jgi:hypothetical protein
MTHCKNCYTTLLGFYCHICGLPNMELLQQPRPNPFSVPPSPPVFTPRRPRGPFGENEQAFSNSLSNLKEHGQQFSEPDSLNPQSFFDAWSPGYQEYHTVNNGSHTVNNGSHNVNNGSHNVNNGSHNVNNTSSLPIQINQNLQSPFQPEHVPNQQNWKKHYTQKTPLNFM